MSRLYSSCVANKQHAWTAKTHRNTKALCGTHNTICSPFARRFQNARLSKSAATHIFIFLAFAAVQKIRVIYSAFGIRILYQCAIEILIKLHFAVVANYDFDCRGLARVIKTSMV